MWVDPSRRDAELGPVVDFDDKMADTAAVAPGTEVVLSSFRAKMGRECIIPALAFEVESAGDGFVKFDLRINGHNDLEYSSLGSQYSRLDQPMRIYREVPPGALVQLVVRNDTAATASYKAAGRIVAHYRENRRP